MIELNLGRNQLEGQLPSSLGGLSSLTLFILSDNRFTSSVPSSLSQLRSLQVLLLQNNQFTSGTQPFVNGTNQPFLETIDVSNNFFSGTVPVQFFYLPSITFFAATSNCYTGTLPRAICAATQLQMLSLPGLSSGASCKTPFWSDRNAFGFNATGSKHLIQGSIPKCIFALQNLTTLSLAANGLVGSLPESGYKNSLVDLNLANNQLTGTIPSFLLTNGLSSLDLSYNKLGGLVMHVQMHSISSPLSLKLNRLSGNLPLSLHEAKNVSVLEGNLFSCSDKYKEYPIYDPHFVLSHPFGSSSFNNFYYFFVAVIFIYTVLLVFVWYVRRLALIEGEASIVSPFLRNLFVVSTKFEAWACLFDVQDKVPVHAMLPSTCHIVSLLACIRSYALLLGSVVFSLFIVIYPSLGSFSTTTYRYAWTATAGYISGSSAGVTLLFFWTLVSCFSFFAVDKYGAGKTSAERMAKLEAIFEKQEEKQADVRSAMTKIQIFLLAFRPLLIFCINVFIVMLVNVSYVYITSKVNETIQIVAKVFLSFFKITWNQLAIPSMLSTNFFYFGQKKEQADAVLNRLFKNEDLFTSAILIFNGIVAPCFATAFTDSRCFKDTLFLPASSATSFNYKSCHQNYDSATCVDYSTFTVRTQVAPPFIYQWQCSTVLLVNYSPVFVITAVFGMLMPLLTLFPRWLVSYLKNCTDRGNGKMSSCTSQGLDTAVQMNPMRENKLITAGGVEAGASEEEKYESRPSTVAPARTPLPAKLYLYRSLLSCIPHLLRSQDEREYLRNDAYAKHPSQPPELENSIVFVDHRFLFSGLINSIIILSTFGIVCPLLAFAMTALIAVQTYQLQLSICRFVAIESSSSNSTSPGKQTSNNITMDMQILERQCAKAPLRPLLDASKYILFFSCFFLSFFLYDIVADRNDAVASLWALFLLNIFNGLFVFAFPFVSPLVREALASRSSLQATCDAIPPQMQEPCAAGEGGGGENKL